MDKFLTYLDVSVRSAEKGNVEVPTLPMPFFPLTLSFRQKKFFLRMCLSLLVLLLFLFYKSHLNVYAISRLFWTSTTALKTPFYSPTPPLPILFIYFVLDNFLLLIVHYVIDLHLKSHNLLNLPFIFGFLTYLIQYVCSWYFWWKHSHKKLPKSKSIQISRAPSLSHNFKTNSLQNKKLQVAKCQNSDWGVFAIFATSEFCKGLSSSHTKTSG